MSNTITSLREAKQFVQIDWGKAPKAGRVFDVTVTCKGCGERRSFHSDAVIDEVFAFAERHMECKRK